MICVCFFMTKYLFCMYYNCIILPSIIVGVINYSNELILSRITRSDWNELLWFCQFGLFCQLRRLANGENEKCSWFLSEYTLYLLGFSVFFCWFTQIQVKRRGMAKLRKIGSDQQIFYLFLLKIYLLRVWFFLHLNS